MLFWEADSCTFYTSTPSVSIGKATTIAAPAIIITATIFPILLPLELTATATIETTRRTAYKIANTFFTLLDDCFSIHLTPSIFKLIILK